MVEELLIFGHICLLLGVFRNTRKCVVMNFLCGDVEKGGPGVLLVVIALPLWEHYKGLANAINGTTKWCKSLTSG